MSKILRYGAIGSVFSIIAVMPALATPIFQSTVDATLSLTSITITEGSGDIDAAVDGEAIIIDSDSFSDGDANSNIVATASPSVATPLTDEPIVLELSATGEAPGIGSAEAFAIADSLAAFENFSATNTIRLDFVLDYNLTAIAQVDDPVDQYAVAYTNFYLQNSQEQDPIVELYLAADTDTPDTAFSMSDIVIFSVFIGPESFASLSFLSDVYGFVGSDVEPASTVPLPSMAGLFGLAAFFGLKRRRAKS